MKNLAPLIYYSLGFLGALVACIMGVVPWEVPGGIFMFGAGHLVPSPLKPATEAAE